MKIQLDTINKTITIEEDTNLHDFYEQLNSLLPNGLWREFTLKVNKIKDNKDSNEIENIKKEIEKYDNFYKDNYKID